MIGWNDADSDPQIDSRPVDTLIQTADRETLLMLVPLLARLGESQSRNR
jgi:hypothetical protein